MAQKIYWRMERGAAREMSEDQSTIDPRYLDLAYLE